MKIANDLPIHPFFFSLTPILANYIYNIDRTRLNDTYRSFAVGIGLMVVIGSLFTLLCKSWRKASLPTSWTIFLFFSFGHVHNFFYEYNPMSLLGRADVLVALWAAFFILGNWFLIRIVKNILEPIKILNIISVSFFVILMVNLVVKADQIPQWQSNAKIHDDSYLSINNLNRPPDIYYIILDEYGREDILSKYYGVDNSSFISFLQAKGFYIPSQSRTNYAITLLSLASSMNMEYLPNDLESLIPPGADHSTPLVELIQNNEVIDYLRKYSYQFIALASSYSYSEFKNAGIYIRQPSYINSFELNLLNTSATALFQDQFSGWQARKMIIETDKIMKKLPEMNQNQQKFFFIHLLATHAPFVFDRDGNKLPAWGFSNPAITNDPAGRSYVDAYREQLLYTNKLLETTITEIIDKSPIEPIIILQADHGPQSMLDWSSIENTCLEERLGIFVALHLPGVNPTVFYPTLSPANIFRIIFNQYFSTGMNLLPDRSYFSLWETSYDFVDVTDQIGSCP